MTATPAITDGYPPAGYPPARHPAETEQLARAVSGDLEAAESVLSQLSSDNKWLQQIMMEAIADSDDLLTWQRFLTCLALHRWNEHADCCRRADRTSSERIDAAIVQLFVNDEIPAVTPVKLSVLHEGLTDPDCQIRSAAASLLGLRGDRRAVETLLETMRKRSIAPRGRLRAIAALVKLKDERGSWAVVEALASDDEEVHAAASRALADFGKMAIPALNQALLNAPGQHVRWHAARALGATRDARAAASLAAALDDPDSGVRWAAADALAAIGAPAVPMILERLCRHAISEPERQAAYHALHQMGPAGGYPYDIQARLQPVLEALRGPAATTTAPTVAFRLLNEWESAP